MDSRELTKQLEADGRYLMRTRGSHHEYKHHIKIGAVTIPHPKQDLPKGTLNSIFKQADLKWRH